MKDRSDHVGSVVHGGAVAVGTVLQDEPARLTYDEGGFAPKIGT